MIYRFAYLDVIADDLFFSCLTADQKLTIHSMPLYAVFAYKDRTLPIRYEAVDILLKLQSEALFHVGLSKGELLMARNAFLRFEAEQELYSVPESEELSGCGVLSPDEFSEFLVTGFLSFNTRATSGGI